MVNVLAYYSDNTILNPAKVHSFICNSVIDCLLARAACLHVQFTSPTVHHQKWRYLPTHKHQADWAEIVLLVGTNPPPSFLFFCCEWVTRTTFHYTWTNSEAQTDQLST